MISTFRTSDFQISGSAISSHKNIHNFYYMGQFDIVEAKNSTKEDNKGRVQPITKVTMRMHHPVREDLLRYLQSNIKSEENVG